MQTEDRLRFDLSKWRKECPEESFRELQEELEVTLPAMARNASLEVLSEALAYYEADRARILEAYPYLETVLSGDPWRPSEQEFHLCETLIPIFRLEIARRQHGEVPAALLQPASAQLPSRIGPPDNEIVRHTARHTDGNVAKRATIIQSNLGTPNKGLCQLLDEQGVPTPEDWVTRTWTAAYKSVEYKPHVQVILSKHRRSRGRP